MSRPISRPEKPYTHQEIIGRVYNHFFIENNPRCALVEKEDISKDYIYCLYNKTGCAAGCLFTEQDANQAEKLSKGNFRIIQLMSRWPVIQFYINESTVLLVKELQRWHDDPRTFKNLDKFEEIARNYNCTVPKT